MPAFNNSMLESYYKIMYKQINHYMELIVHRENDEYFDIHDDHLRLTLDGNFKPDFLFL